ncbi:MAG: acetyl esterase [Gammaproteobacteria bacterium]|jgi:acetyl esterase
MTTKLDPQLEALLQAADDAGVPALHSLPYKESREFYIATSKRLAGNPPDNLDIRDQLIDTPTYRIPTRIYRPQGSQDKALPALIYFHGGGWCIGNLESHDHVCRWLAAHSDCVVISVDYRLAPEHKFPAAVEDAFAATQWISSHADELNIDANRIAVGGDSAGGNLSAVVTLLAREQGGLHLSCQLLIYPATDMLMRFPSHVSCGDGYRLTRTAIAWFVNGYLRDGEDMYDQRASPLMADNHANLPPAFILTAGFDPLKDEGEAYANKLKGGGVEVKYRCYEGMVHGFIAMPGAVDVAKNALLDAASYIKEQLSA